MKSSRVIFACDLDNTLIYSYKEKRLGDVCVELLDGQPQSFMPETAYARLRELTAGVIFVPVTSRSVEQYRRIRFPEDATPSYALMSNGGTLQRGGLIDEAWRRDFRALSLRASEELSAALSLLENDGNTVKYRVVDELFVFAVSADAEETASRLREHIRPDRVEVKTYGRKIYVFPQGLSKGSAVQRLKTELGGFLICAGDSELDIDMLSLADMAIVPNEALAKRLSIPLIAVGNNDTPFSDFVVEMVMRYCTLL